LDILISVLAVVGGVAGIAAGVKFVASKTKNKTDDKVAEVLEALAPIIAEYLRGKGVETARASQSVSKPPREPSRDHRG
jgi:hypothetical protein